MGEWAQYVTTKLRWNEKKNKISLIQARVCNSAAGTKEQ